MKYNMTDLGNAERLEHTHGNDLRYCPEFGYWLVWDGVRWKADPDRSDVQARIVDTVRSIEGELDISAIQDDQVALLKHAEASESGYSMGQMEKIAKSLPSMIVHSEELDSDPMLLNTPNATIDLNTGLARAHKRIDYITRMIPVVYEPAATNSPQWDDYLLTTFRNKKITAYMQRVVGYCLTGLTDEQCLFLLIGGGSNGKTVFLELLRGLLGSDYSQQADAKSFTPRAGNIRNDLAAMKGARIVNAIETNEGEVLDEALVKWITGGDRIRARFLRQEYFEYMPEFKLFLSTNHEPEIKGSDPGIWRRINIIPFRHPVEVKDQIPRLWNHILHDEDSAILNWALKGLKMWQRNRLDPPKSLIDRAKQLRDSSDPVHVFINSHFVTLDADCITLKSKVWDWYIAATKLSDDIEWQPMSKIEFGRKMMSAAPLSSVRERGTGQRAWKGIRINEMATHQVWGEGYEGERSIDT